MVEVIIEVTSQKGFENLKTNINNLEMDFDIGINLLVFVKEDLYLEIREYCLKAFRNGECLVVLDNGEFSKKEYLSKKSSFVFIANENIIIPRRCISKLYEVFIKHPKAGLATGIFSEFPVMYWVEDFYDDEPHKIEKEVNENIVEIDTCPMYGVMVRTQLYKELYFETSLVGYGGMSFGIRLRRLGYKNYLNKNVIYKYGRTE